MTKTLTPQEYDELAWMHIYPHYGGHSDIRILATKSALLLLRAAIDKALDDKNGASDPGDFYAADGEGYGLEIRRVPRSAVQRSKLPYVR